MCGNQALALLQPGAFLEIYAFGTDDSNNHFISNDCLRGVVRRIVAIVAPIFHLYDFCINFLRIPFSFITVCCSDDTLSESISGASKDAFNSVRNCLSSICEIPHKVLLASDNVDYFGSEDRYGED